MALQQYCLRWKYHHSNLQTMFSQLLDRGCFCDVTLACEGQTLKAHRVVLCACSTYFDSILTNGFSDKDPIVIMKDCKFDDIKCLIEFMYKGEINVEHDQLASLLKTAEDLRIKGLAEVSWRDDDELPTRRRSSSMISTTPNNNSISNIPKKRDSISCNNNNNLNSTNDQINSTSAVDSAYIPPSLPHLAASPAAAAAVAVAAAAAAAAASTPSPLSQPTNTAHNENDTQQIKTPQLPHLAPLNDGSPHYRHHCESDESLPPIKKKRGRPPLDNDFDSYSTPKIGYADYPITTFSNNSQLTVTPAAILNDDNSGDHSSRPNSMLEQSLEVQMDCEDDLPMHNIVPKIERPDTPPSLKNYSYDDYNPPSPMEDPGSSSQVILTPQEEAEWCDVIKMNDYLAKGRRPQFWEETFTKRVMEAIKTKDLEMKKAAQLLGVSYGTLYGRYRETYGCLKHPYRGPFMVSRFREFLSEQGPEDIIGRLQRGEITLPRAAELMNTSTTNLSGMMD